MNEAATPSSSVQPTYGRQPASSADDRFREYWMKLDETQATSLEIALSIATLNEQAASQLCDMKTMLRGFQATKGDRLIPKKALLYQKQIWVLEALQKLLAIRGTNATCYIQW